jgi:RecA-family ATPase
VFNVLHAADENDNTEMRKVLDCADLFHQELKAGVCILHHFNKSHDGRLTQRMRGSSAIAGWAEWVMGLSVASQEPREKIRSLEFELKASEPQEHIYFAIDSTEASSKLSRVQYQPPVSTGSKRARFEVV